MSDDWREKVSDEAMPLPFQSSVNGPLFSDGTPVRDCNCTCRIAGCHDPDCAVYGPPQEPGEAP